MKNLENLFEELWKTKFQVALLMARRLALIYIPRNSANRILQHQNETINSAIAEFSFLREGDDPGSPSFDLVRFAFGHLLNIVRFAFLELFISHLLDIVRFAFLEAIY